jgi:TolB-like protein
LSRIRRAVVIGLLAVAVPGPAGLGDACADPEGRAAAPRMSAIAVFPVENLSGGRVPGDAIRQFLVDRLVLDGVEVLGAGVLDDFMTRHRVRYAAGVDAVLGQALRQETGVDGVLIASVELLSAAAPPKAAILARLISLRPTPIIVWADAVGMAGDDAPGFFELGVVHDPDRLLERVLDRLARSLLAYVRSGAAPAGPAPAAKFRPKTFYRRLALEPGRTYSVAVLPFYNLSERRQAGEILALLFASHLSRLPRFQVVERGEVRRQLLEARVIMDGGVSLRDAELVASLVAADFVLAGRVLAYRDYEGAEGTARVEFSSVLIEGRSRQIVWSSDSYNEGRDGVRFFERGTSRTAHAMASQMVRLAAETMAGAR